MDGMRSKNQFVTFVLFVAVSVMLLLAAGCGPSSPQPIVPTAVPTAEGAAALIEMPTAPPVSAAYPAPDLSLDTSGAYPGPDSVAPPLDPLPSGYPPASGDETFLEPRFRIDPVTAGANTVNGQAPPNLAVAIIDVTYNGEVLGIGRTDGSGQFRVPVSNLIEGNRIGIIVGELQPGQTLNEMAEQYFPYRGDGFMNVPNIGIIFDTILVQP